MDNNLYVEMLIGAVLITIYAHERFNTPNNVRALTTAARYYLASIIYLMVYLVSFYLLTKYPYLLEQLQLITPPESGLATAADATPIIIAMVLSMLVPKIPFISNLDARLKKFLHRLAAIPFEAIRLSRELQECSYKIPGHFDPQHEHVKKLYVALKEQGYEQPQDIFVATSAILQKWLNITSLIIQLKGWESSGQFSAFALERNGQLERIRERYDRLASMVYNAYMLNQEMEKHVKRRDELSEVIKNVTSKFDADLSNELSAIYSEICDFISHGLLKSCFMSSSRARTLSKMGFENIHISNHIGLPVNSTVTLFGILLVLTLVNFILFQPKDAATTAVLDRTRILLMVTMIVSIYSAAVICAVVPKQLWSFFQSSTKHHYPAAAYVLSGLIAVVASLAISLAFKTLLYASKPEIAGFAQPFVMAWTNFTTSAYPWLTMSFVCTITLAFLIDWRHPAWIQQKWQRVLTGVIQATVLLSAGALVHWWLSGLAATEQFQGNLPQLSQVIRLSGIIGFVLGYFVPAWYHSSSKLEMASNMSNTQDHPELTKIRRAA